jgi:hypothetical protein
LTGKSSSEGREGELKIKKIGGKKEEIKKETDQVALALFGF